MCIDKVSSEKHNFVCFSARLLPSTSVMPNGTMVQRTVQEGLDETQAPPHHLAVDTQSSCLLGGDVFLQRRSPEALCAIDDYDKIDKQAAL